MVEGKKESRAGRKETAATVVTVAAATAQQLELVIVNRAIIRKITSIRIGRNTFSAYCF